MAKKVLITIAGLDHPDLVTIQHEPCPPAAKLGHCHGR